MNVNIPVAQMTSVSSGTMVFVDAYTGSLDDPQPRYDTYIPHVNNARLEFVYNGPTSPTVPLGDGTTRIQIGMAIRCVNECNGLYAMWVISDDAGGAIVPRISVQRKTNPGQTTFAECNGNNYLTQTSDLQPNGQPYPAPSSVSVGQKHWLDVRIVQERMTVLCDNVVVFTKQLTAAQLDCGPNIRMRADNFKTTFSLRADTYVPNYPVVPSRPRVGCCGLR